MAELRELAQIWEARGVEPDAGRWRWRASSPSQDALGAHARDELGLTEAPRPGRCRRRSTSAVAFTLGALVPLVAFLVAADDGRSAVVVGASALVALAGLGWLGAVARGGHAGSGPSPGSASAAPPPWRSPC